MRNTETAGGSRYSEGKAVQVWTPWKGLDLVWPVSMRDDEFVNCPPTERAAVVAAEINLRQAMSDPLATVPGKVDVYGRPVLALALSAHLLLTVLHCREAGMEIDNLQLGDIPSLGTEEVCRVSECGAEKYAPLDWEVGQSYSTLLSSAMRHVKRAMFYGAGARDDESGLMHIAHAVWNILCLLHFHVDRRDEELDDITPMQGVTAEEYQARRDFLDHDEISANEQRINDLMEQSTEAWKVTQGLLSDYLSDDRFDVP